MVVITPERSNFSRAHCRRPSNLQPTLLGFPWLDPSQRKQADNHNSLISWTWEVLGEVARLQATKTITAFLEHPEDLGRIRSKGPETVAATIWRWAQFKPCAHQHSVSLSRSPGDIGPMRTREAAAYPEDMCKTIAKALLASLDLQCISVSKHDLLPSVGETFVKQPILKAETITMAENFSSTRPLEDKKGSIRHRSCWTWRWNQRRLTLSKKGGGGLEAHPAP